MKKIKTVTKYKFVILLTGAVLLGLHLLISQLIDVSLQLKDIVKLHLFLLVLSYFVLTALLKVKSIDNDKVGFTFLAGVTVKLILGALYFFFFLPKSKIVVLQFILFYLIYLFMETFMAFKIIVWQPAENQSEK
tara:strand:- start:20835 stop:21236 length:402 start_codon:yes stop_codon:yes gene_type:complete